MKVKTRRWGSGMRHIIDGADMSKNMCSVKVKDSPAKHKVLDVTDKSVCSKCSRLLFNEIAAMTSEYSVSDVQIRSIMLGRDEHVIASKGYNYVFVNDRRDLTTKLVPMSSIKKISSANCDSLMFLDHQLSIIDTAIRTYNRDYDVNAVDGMIVGTRLASGGFTDLLAPIAYDVAIVPSHNDYTYPVVTMTNGRIVGIPYTMNRSEFSRKINEHKVRPVSIAEIKSCTNRAGVKQIADIQHISGLRYSVSYSLFPSLISSDSPDRAAKLTDGEMYLIMCTATSRSRGISMQSVTVSATRCSTQSTADTVAAMWKRRVMRIVDELLDSKKRTIVSIIHDHHEGSGASAHDEWHVAEALSFNHQIPSRYIPSYGVDIGMYRANLYGAGGASTLSLATLSTRKIINTTFFLNANSDGTTTLSTESGDNCVASINFGSTTVPLITRSVS